MKILALELSTGVGSIAWRDDGREIFDTDFPNDRKHSGAFFENLHAVLERFGTPELIAVGLGPGSYAGTRIAIATATGLQATTGAQLIGLCSLRAFPTDAAQYSVIGDARRESFFFATVARRECIEGPLLCTRHELLARLAATNHPVVTSEAMGDAPGAMIAHPSARVLAQIASSAELPHAMRTLEPMYLREPHITQPKPVEMSKAHR